MSERKWTPAQQDAIDARDGTLLVSAAAGSGKTAVLVQRVIERLTDEKRPCDADRLLVVTFTNAAAAEMRERISLKISELLEENPNNTHLQRQQVLLSRAHISTIHSFCSELVRDHFYKLNISPDFRISDEHEMKLLREEAVNTVLEELYAEADPAFIALSETVGAGKDDIRLCRTIGTLYDFVRSHPFPHKWLKEKAEMYEPALPVGRTPWGETVLEYTAGAVRHCVELTRRALSMMGEDEAIEKAYREAFSSDLEGLLGLLSAVEEKNWDTILTRVQNFTFAKLKALRGYKDDPLKNKITACRDEVKSTVLKQLRKYYMLSEADCREDLEKLAPLVRQLFLAVERFGEELSALKAERKMADFGDLEHWTIELLVTPTEDGFVRTAEAAALAGRFDEIMVDEYQDTNEAQDMIFRAISRNEKNMFMVGDVKQSIYRFRQAMPEIFLRRKESYPLYDREKNEYPARIVLDKNFRSRKGVTGSVNFVFSQLMSREMGEMDYTKEEELAYGAGYPARGEPDVSLHVLDITEAADDEALDVLEARYIGALIQKMVGERFLVSDGGEQRPVTYRDFCILLRSANAHSAAYVKELQQSGVRAWSDTTGSFFGTTEIAVTLALLRVIDNPIQDIPLLSLLMSPIYGFTPDDLSDIRKKTPGGPLYFALKNMEDGLFGRCAAVLSDIGGYRRLAAAMPADKLILQLFEKTGYPAMVQTMKEGEGRLANLRLLLSYAKGYEKSGYKGLSGFIRFIDRLQEQNADLAAASTMSESDNVVRVMSIHKSKGLEFPVVILAGTSRKFNKDRGDVLLHPRLGLGIKLKDESFTRQYTTLPREAVSLEIEKDGMSEELRVLYVALTRAKENLILLSSLKNPEKVLTKLSASLTGEDRISPHVVRGATSFSDWLLSCALRHPDGTELRKLAGVSEGLTAPCAERWNILLAKPEGACKEAVPAMEESPAAQIDEAAQALIDSRLRYVYPYTQLEKVPAKVAASQLSGEETAVSYAASSRPAFMTGQSMTGAEKGTALHDFMQYADLKTAKKDLQTELSRLKEKGFLSAEQASAVDLKKLEAFLQSALYSRMERSAQVHREFRFTVSLPAKDIRENLPPPLSQEQVVLQGAIDCAFLEEDDYVIVDYKTDRIKDPKALSQRYHKQLELYARALFECTGVRVKECVLYSFYLGREIPLQLS